MSYYVAKRQICRLNQFKFYTVSVGNVGNMEYTSKKLAIECYATYVTLSKNHETRAAGESVVLFENDNIIAEHTGDLENIYD